VVTLAEHELSTDIHVSNPASSETLDFQALLHTYIRAPANEVSISPLLGKRYVDKTEKSPEARSTLKEESVLLLMCARSQILCTRIHHPKSMWSWPGGGLALKLSGFTTLTIWNPQEEAGSKIGDMEEKGW
jgi:glucose-6-phosphate 1-epimerase